MQDIKIIPLRENDAPKTYGSAKGIRDKKGKSNNMIIVNSTSLFFFLNTEIK